MATIEITSKRKYTRSVAVVLGIMVILTFTMILIAAAPGSEMVNAYGDSDTNPISGLGRIYDPDTVQCAFEVMSCNLGQ